MTPLISALILVADAKGEGDITSASNIRLRFQQLKLQWERAGASAATITGLDNVVSMQFDAMQFVQEVLNTRTLVASADSASCRC